MNDDLSEILKDLERHAGAFDLDRNQLGKELLDAAVDGVRQHFNAEIDPDGNPWPALSPKYFEWKSKHFPGMPIGVQTGLMRDEIEGERVIAEDAAEWTMGVTEEGKALADWFTQGDEENNRKPRPFADLNDVSIARSDQILDDHFEGQFK